MSKISSWTDDLDAELVRLRLAGASYRQISARIGKSLACCSERYRLLTRAGGVDAAAPPIAPQQIPLHVELGIKTKTYRVPVLSVGRFDNNAYDAAEDVRANSHRYRASVTLVAVD